MQRAWLCADIARIKRPSRMELSISEPPYGSLGFESFPWPWTASHQHLLTKTQSSEPTGTLVETPGSTLPSSRRWVQGCPHTLCGSLAPKSMWPLSTINIGTLQKCTYRPVVAALNCLLDMGISAKSPFPRLLLTPSPTFQRIRTGPSSKSALGYQDTHSFGALRW